MASQARPAKTIGILTSGGDCSGLNAAIRAVVCRPVVCRAIKFHGWRVLRIRQGRIGRLRHSDEHEELSPRVVPTKIPRVGGAILGTANKGDFGDA
jgi:6-phosphofructokinase